MLSRHARTVLSSLQKDPDAQEGAIESLVRVWQDRHCWLVEVEGRRARAMTAEEALLSLQEVLIDAAICQGDRLWLRGSIVARGSQCLLIVGDMGSAHALLSVALTALGFGLVSVGKAAFDGRRLTPLALPLVFSLSAAEQEALRELAPVLDQQLERVAPGLFAPRIPTAAAEPTHVIFPEVHGGRLSMVRPISAGAARSRLCHALIAAPADQSPFAAVAGLLRHTRGIQMTLGAVPRALEQLSRLLPQWRLEEIG
jgi:hypothetical protein